VKAAIESLGRIHAMAALSAAGWYGRMCVWLALVIVDTRQALLPAAHAAPGQGQLPRQ
jgi:hypothetical protein